MPIRAGKIEFSLKTGKIKVFGAKHKEGSV
jgi:hypothetical protein